MKMVFFDTLCFCLCADSLTVKRSNINELKLKSHYLLYCLTHFNSMNFRLGKIILADLLFIQHFNENFIAFDRFSFNRSESILQASEFFAT